MAIPKARLHLSPEAPAGKGTGGPGDLWPKDSRAPLLPASPCSGLLIFACKPTYGGLALLRGAAQQHPAMYKS